MKLCSTYSSLTLLLLSTLTACGGGSGGEASPEPTPDATQGTAPVVVDTTAPVITLMGESTMTHEAGTDYVDLGATATDDTDGSVSVITSGTVANSVLKSYTITYSATDAAGNETTTERTVTVVDTTAPVITMTGSATIEHPHGEVYTDLGATALDNLDASVTVTVSDAVVIDKVGRYEVTYSATDAAGNVSTSEIREVNVPDLTAPVITLTGESNINLAQGRTYKELGATALDNNDGLTTVTDISSNLDNATLGDYTVTYTSTDTSGNTASLERTITVVEPRPLITIWKTDNDGTSDDNQITIGALLVNPEDATETFDYNYTVDWGDGSSDSGLTDEKTHTYATAGTYTVTISGQFAGFYHQVSGDKDKLVSIEQWGDIQWQTFYRSFAYSDVVSNASDDPDVSQVTTMRHAFDNANNFNHDVTGWDVSNVSDFGFMFAGHDTFNQDVSGWDITGADNLEYLFSGATLFNQDLSAWDISGVKSIEGLFNSASSFDQDLSGWDYSSLVNLDTFVTRSGLSASNYGKLLIKLAATMTKRYVFFDALDLYYPSEAAAAHNKITNELHWDMLDSPEVTP